MKKLKLFAFIAIAGCLALGLNTAFKAEPLAGGISWPFGPADYQNPVLPTNDTIQVAVSNGLTYLKTPTITANSVVVLTPSTALKAGAHVYVEAVTGSGTFTLTFDATNSTVPTITGVSGKTKMQSIVYDGSKFNASAAPYQIN